MQTTFSHDHRVVLCDRCGAPLEAAAAAGHARCRYCGASNALAARVDDTLAARSVPRLPEAERLARLRAEVARRAPLPASIAALAPGGRLAPARGGEALALFQRRRAELRSASSYDAAEELFHLARALGDLAGDQGDPLRRRAVLESALEAVSLPRHRQILRAELAVCACRAGDLRAAEEWLRPCDPASDDLASDSAFRFARAYLDTARRDPAAVLRALGPGPLEVPLDEEHLPACAALRANAWEQLGQVATAVDLLLHLKHGAAPYARYRAQRFLAQHADWHLCARSEPEADARHRAATEGRLGQASKGAQVLLVMAGYFALAALLCVTLFALELADVIVTLVPPHELAVCAFAMLLVGGILGALVASTRRQRAGRARMRAAGTFAPAQVEDRQASSDFAEGVRSTTLSLLVMPEGRAPYRAGVTALVADEHAQDHPVGSMVLVRIHPDDPHRVEIEEG